MTKKDLIPGAGKGWMVPMDIKRGKRDLQLKFDRAMLRYAETPFDELKAMLEDGIALPAVDKLAIKQIVRAIERGDPGTLEMVLYTCVKKNKKRPNGTGKKKGEAEPAPSLPDDVE